MIHIIKDLYVDPEDLSYTLCRKKTAVRNGESTEVYDRLGYYSSLKSAVKGANEQYRKELLQERDYTLEEAIKQLRKADDVLENVMYRALGDK